MSLHGAAYSVLKSDGTEDDIVVAATAVVYTHSFKMNKGVYFGVWAKLQSTLTGEDVKVELEQSYALPTVEGAAETALWVIPDSASAIFAQINDELAHIATLSPVPMNYGRYKLTGLGSNPSDTVVKIKNFMQEPTY